MNEEFERWYEDFKKSDYFKEYGITVKTVESCCESIFKVE